MNVIQPHNNQNVDVNNGEYNEESVGARLNRKLLSQALCQEYETTSHEYNNTHCPEGN